LRSITAEGRKEAKKIDAEIHEMKDFAKERASLENLVYFFIFSLAFSTQH